MMDEVAKREVIMECQDEEASLPSHPKFRHKQFFRSRTTSTPAALGYAQDNALESPLFISLARSDSDSNNVTPSETSSSSHSSLSPTSSQEFPARKRVSVSDEDGGSRSSGSGEEKNGDSQGMNDLMEGNAKKRRPYNPLPCAIKETPIYQDYRRRNADAVARCREKKKLEEQQKVQELDTLRRANKEQNFEIEKLKVHNRALEHQVSLYREQISLLTRQHTNNSPKIVLPVAYTGMLKMEPSPKPSPNPINKPESTPTIMEEK
ncbi:unnamed protein product, partial [Mesorhabditis belari]|uniref:BZIP domain-containing protein n=1 Tax=Mesorhabditis belari TaxID=2138241 RepID=A0AAF3FFZ0_9BILA